MAHKTKQLTFRIESDLGDQLVAAAAKDQRPLSQFCRLLLVNGLRAAERQAEGSR
jgi:uncharacterized protein (DUF1778 family)